MWDVITHPFRNFNGGLVKSPFKVGFDDPEVISGYS